MPEKSLPVSDDDARPWGELASLAVERISTAVEGMHEAIAHPWFRLAGPAQTHLRNAYTSATSVVYGSVRLVARATGRMSDMMTGNRTSTPSARSDALQAVANAVWGDELARRSSSMAIGMAVHDRSGAVVRLDSPSLEIAFPGRSSRLAVLLHGLGQTERCFGPSDGSEGLASILGSSGWVPLLVRYNSGRPVSVNGGELSKLLGELVENWPGPVEEIAMVGFSMGGLVARSAIGSGLTASAPWTEAVHHVVTIATPHSGSPIEKGVEATSRSLMAVPQTRPLGGFLAQRSAGIRDLRSGVDVPPAHEGVEHHVIAAVLTTDPGNAAGAVIGDLVVRPASATGRRHFRADNRTVVGGRRHYDILDDPSLAHRILAWIDPDRADRP